MLMPYRPEELFNPRLGDEHATLTILRWGHSTETVALIGGSMPEARGPRNRLQVLDAEYNGTVTIRGLRFGPGAH